MKIGRNEPCPCGSGSKVKRCCGVDGVRRRDGAAEDLFGAALLFPQLRPSSASFDSWATTAPDVLSRELLEAGGTALGAAERERIVSVLPDRYPQVWAGLVVEVGDVELAQVLIVSGAILAGLEERHRPLDALGLELAREEPDAVEALALVIEARDLWSVLEAAEAAEGASADELWSDWHEERLAALVDRVRVQSGELAHACTAYERHERIRRRLRRELLLDAQPNVFELLRAAA